MYYCMKKAMTKQKNANSEWSTILSTRDSSGLSSPSFIKCSVFDLVMQIIILNASMIVILIIAITNYSLSNSSITVF